MKLCIVVLLWEATDTHPLQWASQNISILDTGKHLVGWMGYIHSLTTAKELM